MISWLSLDDATRDSVILKINELIEQFNRLEREIESLRVVYYGNED